MTTPSLNRGLPNGPVQTSGALDFSLKSIIDRTDRTVVIPVTPGNPKNFSTPGSQPSQQPLRHPKECTQLRSVKKLLRSSCTVQFLNQAHSAMMTAKHS